MKIRNKKLLTKSIAMAIFMSSTLYTMPITHAAFNNNTLPDNGTGNVTINSANNIMNISQAEQNAVIQWNDFSIGANATVNFSKTDGGSFNTLNYVNSGNLSQIYGTINADKGNIYIVNPAGVQIGNSAQINVGSLYVSNNLNNDKLKNTFGEITINSLPKSTVSGGELMSLGNINATNVIFDGNRIVLDVDRVKNGQDQLGVGNITIKTTQTDFDNKNVVLGYTAYDSGANKTTYENKNDGTPLAKLEGVSGKTELTKKDGFMWVKDGEQLQAMNTNLGGNYAFRNSIDLNSINNFKSINDFEGNLDGLGNEVYGLHIDEKTDNTGLFAKTDGATIRNFNLISGSIISTENNAGAVVGNANNTVIENVKNTINVTGANNVGGIIGTGSNVTLNGVVNAGAIKGNSNVGGLAGNLSSSTLNGESYNLGDIKGTVNNIGGLVGSASHSTIGNKTGFQMYNHLDVEGGYNVGGIVGNLENGSTVQNVSNDGNVKATGYTEGKYSYHTNNSKMSSGANMNTSEIASKPVNVANVGGIVGKSDSSTDKNKINNVLNNGDISAKLDTTTNANMPYYTAGNVGGVVGSAVNTDISNATNKENDVRGAHNVGGIAGYLESGTITKAINNGGDIMATGARNGNDIVKEFIRYYSGTGGDESFIVGNIGGIVGYMYGDSAYINTSANRGTVHTEDIVDEGNILDTSKAANVGGIVGKIDRSTTISMDNIKKPTNGQQNKYAISNSYNTGNVRGYTGVGGVAGMMYNGEIVGSYNIGEIRSTRKDTTSVSPLNMGGIVGDSTEETSAKISLYDVYNKGQIGDEEFVYKGRHVGGIAGRLSGDVEKSYNNGDIYNGATVTGGIAGWWVKGDITNSFNTGNITNYSIVGSANGSNVGGIAGGMGIYQTDLSSKLENVYNLGTIRSIKGASNTKNTVGGMIGTIGGLNSVGRLTIKNVYTLGNLYSVDGNTETVETNMIGSYYTGSHNVKIENAYYIDTTGNGRTLSSKSGTTPKAPTKLISKSESISGDLGVYKSDDGNGFNTSDWRIYKGTTPILNAFMPETNGKFNDKNVVTDGIGNITNVQYGTAYDPLLTIINTNDNITLDWKNLGIYGDAGLAVYSDKNGNGGGLTLNNFKNSDKGVGLFGGIIYSDGALNIKSYDSDKNNAENIGLGSFSKLYGASVTIDAGKTGTVDSYGSIISTGNNNIKGDITITGANVNTYGEIKTAVKGQTTTIDGIKGSISDEYKYNIGSDLTDQNAEMSNIAEGYAHTVTAGEDSTGDVFISATDGDVNIYYGNMEKGIIDTQGNVSLSGNNVYVDSDMVIGGNLNATADSIGEIVLDISNIGKVSLKKYTNNLYKALVANSGKLNSADSIRDIINNLETKIDLKDDQLTTFANYLYTTYVDTGKLNSKATESAISDAIIKGRMHNFLKSFSNKATDKKYINFKGTDNAKITVDLWDGSSFNLKKYDQGGNTLSTELDSLYIKTNGDNLPNTQTGKDFVYIWVADGEQLKGIQKYANENTNSKILSYNFALKNDINATDVDKYQSIGGNGTAFTGKFDGRENRIIGLNVENKDNSKTDNVGVFGTIGEKGIVKNLKVYSSTFKGYDNVGAIAGTNNGTIDNVTTLGNTVEALGSKSSAELDGTPFDNTDNIFVNVGAAGGVVGTNNGAVDNATSRDSVIAGKDANFGGALTTAGGIAGINTGLVSNSQSHSAVIASGKDNTYSLGGIVGVNTASDKDQDGNIIKGLDNVNAYGVTGSSILVDNTGGIAGLNSGTLNDAYNESIVKGSSNVGGIAGTNSGEISLIVNGASVTAEDDYTGGLVGSTTGKISDGRNNGVITGNDYVGGLVGSNGSGVTLKDLTNDSSAEIIGENYVGGIAGRNDGIITAKDQTNLINRGSITGQNYVGGVVGQNFGAIDNINNSITLNVSSNDGKYFGGVAGINEENATINNATNTGNITAEGAIYVGGVVGYNKGILNGLNGNYGNVKGKDQVGGVVGQNDTAIENVNAYNEGSVTATDGGAGGIFATYNGNILNSTLTNKGDVKGTNIGGTGGIATVNSGNISNSTLINEGNVTNENSDYVGGIFGQKTGTNTTITGSTLSNKGEVKGKDYVGGIFGSNESTISKSTMTNEVGGNVTGKNYVGGLIGINSGTITGGRDDANTYYKYQIYNNGTITATGNGYNIGGLIGKNTGSLTAGYNTGNIVASGSSNVGGIVGTNEGTVKEVFNTIAGNGSVTGNTNVGGLIGTNSGTLSNAYSTSFVEGNTDVGNVVGDNTSGTVTNIYATNTKGNLIGTNNGTINTSYSFSSSDKNKTNITYLEKEADQKDKDNYSSFFDENTWKFYDGNTNPLLKVFLTKAEFVPAKDKDGNNVKPYFVYNGNKQGVLIHYDGSKNIVEVLDAKNIVIGTIKVADENAAHSLKDYINTIGQGNQLINGVQFIDADEYEMLFSQQINTDGENGNPNNLGFDFVTSLDNTNPNNDPPMITNDKAKLTITGNDLDRIYGNTDIQNGDYGITIDGWVNGEDHSNLIGLNHNSIKDGALTGNTAGKVTNDVGDYTWTGNIIGSLKNYEFNTTVKGDSKVNKADLVVDLNKVYHTYGDPNLKDYGISGVEGLTNGDEASKDKLDVEMTKDTALKDNNTHTNNAGENYTWTGNVSGIEGLENNYNITVNEGQSVVNKADLTIDLNENVHHEYGKPNLDDYVITGTEGLTNGDEAFEDKLDVTMTHDDALTDNNTHTKPAGGDYTWTGSVDGIEGLEDNYNITINPGKSTVDKGHLTITVDDSNTTVGDNPNYGGTVDGWANGDNPNDFDINFGLDDDSIIGQPGKHDGVIGVIIDGTFYPSGTEDDVFNNYDVTINAGDLTVLKPFDINDNKNWSHLYKDAPWDRNRDFKERKAEFNFVDGAIPLDEAVEEV